MGKQDIDNYDKSLAEEFASKMFQFLNGGMLSLMISIGYKTGLFDILSELEPSTSQEIAQETKPLMSDMLENGLVLCGVKKWP